MAASGIHPAAQVPAFCDKGDAADFMNSGLAKGTTWG